MEFGERLQELRKQKKITRDELAKALKLSYSAIAKYETNVRKPDQDTLKKIADFFDVTVDYLLGRSNHRKLTKKDEKDISKIIEETKQKIENTEGLMLDGEILGPEDIESIINAMRVGLEMAKIKNKEKYGRKKTNKQK